MRLKGSVRQINLLSLFFLLNLNFFISTRIAKLAPVLTRQNSIRVQGIFFGVLRKTPTYDASPKVSKVFCTKASAIVGFHDFYWVLELIFLIVQKSVHFKPK